MQLQERLSEWIDEDIVIDCTSPFVAIGRLTKVGQDFVELHQADMHDLRDSSTSRETYLVKTARYGIQKTRQVVLVRTNDVVGFSRLKDVIAE